MPPLVIPTPLLHFPSKATPSPLFLHPFHPAAAVRVFLLCSLLLLLSSTLESIPPSPPLWSCSKTGTGRIIPRSAPQTPHDLPPRSTEYLQFGRDTRVHHLHLLFHSTGDLKMEVKELRESFYFACTSQFWRMAVLWTLSVIISYLQLLIPSFFYLKSRSYARLNPSQLPCKTTAPLSTAGNRMPICIITGATTGLGAATALALSKEGFYVVLVGRSSHLVSKAISDIRRQNKDAQLKGFQADLSSFKSIMQFKGSLQQWLLNSDMHSSVQLLINNAGILATSSRFTPEGYDEMMGTNYIGAFSLTKVLLPLLRNSPVPSRIVNVTSFTHRNVSYAQVNKDTVSGKCFSQSKCYPCASIYEYSKLCLILFSYELHRQLDLMENSKLISVIAADPGTVETNIMREVPLYLSQLAFWVLKLLGLLQSPDIGARSIIDAALAPPEISGVYFFGGNGRTLDSSALSYNNKLSKELWATSCDLFQESLLASNTSSTSTGDMGLTTTF